MIFFVDTSFWVALIRERDTHHPDARLLQQQLSASLVTSDRVMEETWTFLRRRAGHRLAMRFTDEMGALESKGDLAIERLGTQVVDAAWRWLTLHDERSYSFVDSSSFALMRYLGLTRALAFDGDFTAAGFIELRPS